MYCAKRDFNKLPRLNELILLIDEYWIGEGFWDEDQEKEAKSEAKENYNQLL